MSGRWRTNRRITLAKANNKCSHCGSDEDPTVDHIQPRSEGGSDELDNLRVLCSKCHEWLNKYGALYPEKLPSKINVKSYNPYEDPHAWLFYPNRYQD